MAIRGSLLKSGSSSGISQDMVMQILAAGARQVPKAGALERLFALPSAVGSIPDILYKSKYKGANVMEEYLKNLVGGVKTTFMGEKKEDPYKQLSDIAVREGHLEGQDFGTKAARFGLDVAGGIALDPLTYINPLTGIGKVAAQNLSKSVIKEVGEKATKELTEDVVTKMAERGIKSVTSGLSDDVSKALLKFGRDLPQKSAVKVAGQTIRNPVVAESLKFLSSPLSSVARGGKALAKGALPKATGEMEEALLKMFKPGEYAEKIGLGDLQKYIKKGESGLKWQDRKLSKAFGDITRELQGLPQEVQKQFGALVEGEIPIEKFAGSMDTGVLGGLVSRVQGINKEVTQSLTERGLLKEAIQEVPEEIGKFKTGRMGNEFVFKNISAAKKAQEILEDTGMSTVHKGGKTLLSKVEDVPGIKELLRSEDFKGITGDVVEQIKKENYFPRVVKGYSEKFIRNEMGDLGPIIMTDKRVINELKKDGFVSKETIGQIRNQPFVRGRLKGLADPLKWLEGSNLQRTMGTLKEGMEKGVVYSEDAAQNFLKGTLRGSRAAQEFDIIQGLVDVADDYGNKMFHTAEDVGEKAEKFIKMELGDTTLFVDPQFAPAKELVKNYTKDFFGDEGMDYMAGIYDKGMKYWKAFVTGRGPGFLGFQIRNAMGDTTNMILNGFRNRGGAFDKAFKILQDEDKIAQTIQNEGLEAAQKAFGADLVEAYQEAGQRGVLTAMGQFQEAVGEARGLTAKITDPKKIFTKREEFSKLAMFLDSKSSGLGWEESAQKAFASNFDYSNLSDFEGNVMKRLIPFYTFARKNAEFHLTNMAENPGRYAAMRHLITGVQKDLGADLSEEDWAALPDWMKAGMAVPISKKGEDVTMLSSFGSPVESMAESLTPSGLAKQLSPAVKMPIELLTGTDLFTGKRIEEGRYGGRYESFPEPIKKLLKYRETEMTTKAGKKYTKKTVDPYMAYLMANLPYSGPISTAYKRVTDVPKSPASLANLVSGARVYTRNLEQERAQREREETKRLEDFLLKRGIGETYTSFYIPREIRNELLR